MRWIWLAVPMLAITAACGEAGPDGAATPGAEMTPGKWRIVTEIVDLKSDTMSDNALKRMTNTPPVVERCFSASETSRVSTVFPAAPGDCTIERDSLRDGLVEGKSQCRDGDATSETTITGSYSATTLDVVSDSVSNFPGNELGKVTVKMRAQGVRIGDCAS